MARDYKAEYERRKARGAAAGKTPAQSTGHYKRGTPGARPRSGQSPRGVPLSGSRVWSGPDAVDGAEAHIARLGPSSIVHIYVQGSFRGVNDTWQIFPHGGIRAGALQGTDLYSTIRAAIDGGQVASGSNPAINPANRHQKSGRFAPEGASNAPAGLDVHQVIVQWTRR